MTTAAISVQSVSKRFRIPLDHGGTLQYRFSHPLRSSRYRNLTALDDVSFDVRPGEFIGITGPNGCGKSTLLKTISRIYEPDEGRVAVRGRISPFLELGVGFKYELTARENVFLGGAVLGLTHRQLETRVHDVFEFAELTAFADQKLKNYSSGMAVRLAFAVAMLADADILLLDEVLAVGDARFQEKCFDVFAYYKRIKRTIILVTHDLSTLDLYCDRVLLMQSGRIVADGVPSEVTAQYRRLVGQMSEHDAPTNDASGKTFAGRRWGSRELEITDIRLVDQEGHPHYSFVTGESMTLVVDYVSNDLEGDFACALAFKRSDGAFLGGPNTRTSRYPLPRIGAGGRGSISYDVNALPLLGASYLLSVGLYDEHLNHAFDVLEDVLEFRVSDDRGRLGMVEMGGEWSNRFDARPGDSGTHNSDGVAAGGQDS